MIEIRKFDELGLFEVESENHTGKYYVVDLMQRSCTCPHHRFRGAFCKHLHAVKELHAPRDIAPRIVDYAEVY